MLGISWYEFLVVLLMSFIFLKPADFRKIIVAIRDAINFINSLVRDVTTTVEKSIALDEFKIDDFFVVNKNSQNTKDATADFDTTSPTGEIEATLTKNKEQGLKNHVQNHSQNHEESHTKNMKAKHEN